MKPLAVIPIPGSFVVMRSVLAWLMMFGVIAGLCGRVMAVDHVHVEGHDAQHCEHEHQPHHHDDDDGGDGKHSPDCPSGQHEHHSHACCQASPLPPVDAGPQFLRVPSASLLAVNWVTALPPDDPVFALDKPPLN